MAQLQKREKILAGVAGAALIIFVLNQFVCGKKESPSPEVAQTNVEAEQVEPERPKSFGSTPQRSQRLRPAKKITFTKWARDPFAEAYRLAQFDPAQGDSSDFALRGVIWKGSEAHVLIGDLILKKGERNGDLKILDIQQDRVVCRKANKIITLVLQENED